MSKGQETANFAGLDLTTHLDIVLDSVDQGFTVINLNLTDTKLNGDHFKNNLLPWFKNNISVTVIDISNNLLNSSVSEVAILKEFGVEMTQDTPNFIPGSPAYQGKSIIAKDTGLSDNTIKLLLNEGEHATKAKEDREKSIQASQKKTEA